MATFILASAKLLAKLPAAKAIMLPATMRQVLPKTASTCCWYSAMKALSAGGRWTTTKAMKAANCERPKPAQTTRRSRLYAVTSVRMSPKM